MKDRIICNLLESLTNHLLCIMTIDHTLVVIVIIRDFVIEDFKLDPNWVVFEIGYLLKQNYCPNISYISLFND